MKLSYSYFRNEYKKLASLGFGVTEKIKDGNLSILLINLFIKKLVVKRIVSAI